MAVLPCDHRGASQGQLKIECCGGKWEKFACGMFGECIDHPLTEAAKNEIGKEFADCRNCIVRQVQGRVVGMVKAPERVASKVTKSPAKSLMESALTSGVEVFKIEEKSLLQTPDYETNPSICIDPASGDYFMAYQAGEQAIYITKTHSMWQPMKPDDCYLVKNPRLDESVKGVFEPRLFAHAGRLWLQYTGEAKDRKLTTFVGEISPAGMFNTHFAVNFPRAEKRARDYTFFETEGGPPGCVYNWAPTVILQPDKDFNMKPVIVSGVNSRPTHFEIAGGAPPVAMPGCWCEFFKMSFHNGHRRITGIGVLTMSPDLQVTAISLSPIYLPDVNEAIEAAPYGAVYDRDKWWVSIGYGGKSCRIISIEPDAIEKALKPPGE